MNLTTISSRTAWVALLTLTSFAQMTHAAESGERCKSLYVSELARFESRALEAATQLQRLKAAKKKSYDKAAVPGAIAGATAGALMGASTLSPGDSKLWNVGVPTLFFGIVGPSAGGLVSDIRFNRAHKSEIRQLQTLVDRRNAILDVLTLIDISENLPIYNQQIAKATLDPNSITRDELHAISLKQSSAENTLVIDSDTYRNEIAPLLGKDCVLKDCGERAPYDQAKSELATKFAKNLLLLDESGRICQDSRLLTRKEVMALVNNMY